MRLTSNDQFDFQKLVDNHINAIICSSGYESRCTSFVRNNRFTSDFKFVLSFKSHQNHPQRIENDSYFRKNNFEFIELDNDGDLEIAKIISRISEASLGDVTILIDYSSMTSLWYASILHTFTKLPSVKTFRLLFCYSYAQFTPAIESTIYNKNVTPFFGFSTLSIPDKPSALIIGLGYENDKAFGLSEYLDAETYIFYTEQEENNEEYTAEVEKYNVDLLSIIKRENIIKYPLFDLNLSQNILYEVCSDLYDYYRIILAPCGPKPFTLLCLIMSIKFGNIDVWRISSDSSDIIYERTSNNKFSIYECVFS